MRSVNHRFRCTVMLTTLGIWVWAGLLWGATHWGPVGFLFGLSTVAFLAAAAWVCFSDLDKLP